MSREGKEGRLWEEGEGEREGGIIMAQVVTVVHVVSFPDQFACRRSRSGNILLQFGSWYLQSLIHYVSGI